MTFGIYIFPIEYVSTYLLYYLLFNYDALINYNFRNCRSLFTSLRYYALWCCVM